MNEGYIEPIKSEDTEKRCLYIIKNQFGMTKIGVSSDIQRRMNELRLTGGVKILNGWYSQPLKFAMMREKHLHFLFRETRQDGEWFEGEGHDVYVAKTINDMSYFWQEFIINKENKVIPQGSAVQSTPDSEELERKRIEDNKLNSLYKSKQKEIHQYHQKLKVISDRIEIEYNKVQEKINSHVSSIIPHIIISFLYSIIAYNFGEEGKFNFKLFIMYTFFFSSIYCVVSVINYVKLRKVATSRLKRLHSTFSLALQKNSYDYRFIIDYKEGKETILNESKSIISSIESDINEAKKQIEEIQNFQ